MPPVSRLGDSYPKRKFINKKYYITREGIVHSVATGKPLKTYINESGQVWIKMLTNRRKIFRYHYPKVLAIKAFHGKFVKNHRHIIHLDGDKTNNHIENLKMVDDYESIYYRNKDLLDELSGVSCPLNGDMQYCIDNKIPMIDYCDYLNINYLIVSDGRIISMYECKVMNLSISKTGYKYVNIKSFTIIAHAKRERKLKVHRLVMLTFKYIDIHESMTVNHIDEDKLNNNIDNLEWCSDIVNIRKYYKRENPEELRYILVNEHKFKRIVLAAKYIARLEKVNYSNLSSMISGVLYRGKNSNYLGKYFIRYGEVYEKEKICHQ